ncbi:nuclear transport factor 2 family protein [Novosphingobium malaysiense]|nr:nuclear transport factor 2 family protein [Novosphingobium malaysiense]
MLRSIMKAERHIRSEYGTRMVGVMDTIGAHPHFAMMLQPGMVTVLSGRDDIDTMYKGSVENAAPQASRLLSQRATDWYVFVENVPTRLWVQSGEFKTVQTVTMFVTDDENGITGEYAWQRYYPPTPPVETDGELLPDRSLRNLQMHEDLLDAVCRGDAAALSASLTPDCIWAQRDYRSSTEGGEIVNLQSAPAAADFVCKCHAALNPVHVSILNRQVTDWFVFAEELWVVEPEAGERRQYRTAVVYAVDENGKFEAVLGFGKAMEALSPSAGKKMGLAFWPEGVGPDPRSHKGYPEG